MFDILPDGYFPTGAKYVKRFGEHVVVDQARVDAKRCHEQNDVTTAEEYLPHFVCLEFIFQLIFAQHHEESKQKHD